MKKAGELFSSEILAAEDQENAVTTDGTSGIPGVENFGWQVPGVKFIHLGAGTGVYSHFSNRRDHAAY